MKRFGIRQEECRYRILSAARCYRTANIGENRCAMTKGRYHYSHFEFLTFHGYGYLRFPDALNFYIFHSVVIDS